MQTCASTSPPATGRASIIVTRHLIQGTGKPTNRLAILGTYQREPPEAADDATHPNQQAMPEASQERPATMKDEQQLHHIRNLWSCMAFEIKRMKRAIRARTPSIALKILPNVARSTVLAPSQAARLRA
jgi:hypothetical protein